MAQCVMLHIDGSGSSRGRRVEVGGERGGGEREGREQISPNFLRKLLKNILAPNETSEMRVRCA
jgi:hypothetical protein